jgi:tetratricopeptide (TPR) repeat protein
LKNLFSISDQTKKVLTGIFIIVALSFLVAYIYYNGKNKAEDPRVVQTKYLFRQYDELMKKGDYYSALPLLDDIEKILIKVPGYPESYEPGIVYNNRGSAYLTIALYAGKDSSESARLLELAKKNIDSSILIYNSWIGKTGALSRDELLHYVKPFFPEDEPAFRGARYERIVKKRVADLVLAQKETSRRLSVCYTNLGIVFRHQHKQDEASESYIKAIQLWKDNYTARNNFNVLMGKPPRDRSVINKLFPPDKRNFN